MTLTPISCPDAVSLLAQGAILVDIRKADERARARIPGSLHIPLGPLPEGIARKGTPAVIFHCSSGFRTELNGPRLAEAAGAPAYMLDGGLDAWHTAGLPITLAHRAAERAARPNQPSSPLGLRG